LEEALTFVQGLLGKKIDILGMDACYMAMVEVAYQIKDCAQIMVASEASIPGDGWQYDCILESLVANPDQSSEQFASEIVNCYYQQYVGSASGVTLSAIDLAGIDLLAGEISDLANQIINDHATPKNNYRDARNITQHYNSSLGFEYIDLRDFVIKLEDYTYSNQVLQAANQINQTLQSSGVIISNTYCGSSVKNSHGLSIYFPYYSYDNYYNYTNFSQDTLWDEMLFHLGY
ncbi:MAG: clostripain-related cysteine peptidase, partial [Candidatus Caldatribacteriota bacterium]